jgi:hypothetical protein
MLGPVVSVSKQTPMHRAEQAMTSFFLLRRLRLVGTGVPSHRPRVLHFLAGMLLAAVAEFATHGCGVQSGSPPDLIVLKVTDLGTLPTNPDILGRDGGYSAVFQGYSTWLYGDTFLAKPNAEDFTLISDSWSDTTDLKCAGWHYGLSGTPGFNWCAHDDPPRDVGRTDFQCSSQQQQLPGTAMRRQMGALARIDPCRSHLRPCADFLHVGLCAAGSFNFQAIGNSVATWQSFQDQPQRHR